MVTTLVAGTILVFTSFWAGVAVNKVSGNAVLYKLAQDPNSYNGIIETHNNLGISGPRLLELFQARLLQSEDLMRPKNVRVSHYYDEFMRYLSPQSTDTQDFDGVCFPEGSIVSKLTRDVNVVPNVHSHNDYWRNLPLLEALCYGVPSVEADVWLVNNDSELAVGHNKEFLDVSHKTLGSLYTRPLLNMLNEVNCDFDEKDQNVGVFYNSPEKSLYLYIDFKSEDSTQTYKLLMEEYLKPLIDMGYLSFFDLSSNTTVWNPVTVILTGDYPTETSVLDGSNGDGYLGSNQRFVFLDAPLHKLQNEHASLSVVASASLNQLLEGCVPSQSGELFTRGVLSEEAIGCIKPKIQRAHALGLKTRIWGVPTWPIKTKQALWQQEIFDLQVDFLNTEDLAIVTQM